MFKPWLGQKNVTIQIYNQIIVCILKEKLYLNYNNSYFTRRTRRFLYVRIKNVVPTKV